MRKAKPPKAETATSKPVRFQRRKDGAWEKGVMFSAGGRMLAISTKNETLLCPPHKVKQ